MSAAKKVSSKPETKIVLKGRPVLIVSEMEDGNVEVRIDKSPYPDPGVWGVIIADLVEHVANAYAHDGFDRKQALAEIRTIVLKEMVNPTDTIIDLGIEEN
jgi:hypothetical protein